MESCPARGLLAWLEQVPDHRGRQGQRFALSAMLAAVVCGVLCGLSHVRELVEWLHAQRPGFWHLLGFHRIPPKETCFRDLLAEVDPAALEQALLHFLNEVEAARPSAPPSAESDLAATCVDGKTLRGSLKLHEKAIHMLNAWDVRTGRVFRQQPVGGTNEAKAAVEMFAEFLLTGKLVIGDAMFCQRDVCQQVLDSGGEYLVAVKDNQPQLLRDVQASFVDPGGFSPLRKAPPSVAAAHGQNLA